MVADTVNLNNRAGAKGDMSHTVDEMLEDLGYYPDKWREQQTEHYKIMAESKKFYKIHDYIHEKHVKIISYEPWEGQRP